MSEIERGEDWRDRAACLTEDPEIFFPVGHSGKTYRQTREAKIICKSCQVQEECLELALNNDEGYGIWGSYTEDERAALKRRIGRQAL